MLSYPVPPSMIPYLASNHDARIPSDDDGSVASTSSAPSFSDSSHSLFAAIEKSGLKLMEKTPSTLLNEDDAYK